MINSEKENVQFQNYYKADVWLKNMQKIFENRGESYFDGKKQNAWKITFFKKCVKKIAERVPNSINKQYSSLMEFDKKII